MLVIETNYFSSRLMYIKQLVFENRYICLSTYTTEKNMISENITTSKIMLLVKVFVI